LQERLKEAALMHGKAVVVGPVFDTIKRVEDGIVQETIDREKLRWPLAWACSTGHEPDADPPPPDWFMGAVVVE
jgi:hypothetical protein